VEERETAGITTRLILDYVRARRGDAGVREMLDLAGETRPLHVLENPRVWSTYNARVRLFDAAGQVTGDPAVAQRIGESVLTSRAHPVLRATVARLGSPRALFRALPTVHSKFDSAAATRLLELGDNRAVVAFRTLPRHEPNRHDCLFVHGLLSQCGVLWGLPPALVNQETCQMDGAPECIFEVTWQGSWRLSLRSQLGRRAQSLLGPGRGRGPVEPGGASSADTPELASVYRAQLSELQQTLLELMETRDLDQVLRRVTDRAGLAVASQRLLFAALPWPDAPPRVYSDGFDEAEAERLAGDALAGREPIFEIAGARAEVIVADVRSPERDYGKIVAFSAAPFIAEEEELLAAYAKLAAATLDTVFALDTARDRQRSAEILGAFSRQLIEVRDLNELVHVTVSAVRAVGNADTAILLGHDEENGILRSLGHDGYSADLAAVLDDLVVRPEDTPMLEQILSVPEEPRFFHRADTDPYIRAMFEFFDIEVSALMAVRSEHRVFGIIGACWQPGSPNTPEMDRELFGRLGSIADQAAGAWEKTLLLEQVRHQASIDSLTGLANRRVFTELLAELLGHDHGSQLAVLFCDLDRFKGVNDALGHAAGDELLVAVGRRLSHCVRSDDLVARLGGDEFTVLLTEVDGPQTLHAFAAKVRGEMADPFELEGSQLVVHLSIGAVITRPGELSVKDVLRRADTAMYTAKARGGDRLLLFEEHMLLVRSERVELEASLAEAANHLDQFAVLYQPQVALDSNRIVGAEALVRWDHPLRGRLTPDRFLALAEDTGFVVPMDLHVLRTALTDAAAWRAEGLAIQIAVNFSASTLTSPDLVTLVKRELELADVPGTLLEIELTESAAVTDAADLGDKLLQLCDLGISIAIDDVGTGYSSLALLHRLPAQRIKIDRSFVTKITEDPVSRSVVEAVLLLADRLGQGVIAEGIETPEQADALLRLGCRLGQGYLYSRPVEPAELARLARGVEGRALPS
jgi:diguanylate cyclase (GGDEF)-like protein